MNKKLKHGWLVTLIFSVISLLYLYPIILVVINSFKKKAYISRVPFDLPKDNMFVGLENYIRGIEQTKFFEAFSWSLFITVGGVAVIILCCSMCAWFISRVNTWWTKLIYMLCLFAMVVPFQMEMYTLSKIANMLRLNTPWGLIFIYLGFGAGLAVFMFTGFMKSIPLEIEEAAMIDGCTPIQTFFKVVLPISKPTCITVMILQAMWIWNDYLLPSLVLDTKKYRTIPIAVQYLKGGYGSVDMGAMMGALVLSIIPISSDQPIHVSPTMIDYKLLQRKNDIQDYGYDEQLQYYIYPNGQCQESSRDQGHVLAGLHNYVAIAEMAWNQGDSLYSSLDNRLLLGLEWSYRYNLSSIQSYKKQETPWEPTGLTKDMNEVTFDNGKYLQIKSRSGRWESVNISSHGRGDVAGTGGTREMALAHYAVRSGLPAEKYTWLQRYRDYMIERYGCENWGVAPNWFYEWTGWGTLTKRLTPWMAGDPVTFSTGKRVSGLHQLDRKSVV